MEHEANGVFDNDPNIPTSQHPVLTALNDKIDNLTKQLEEANNSRQYYINLANDRLNTIQRNRDTASKFEETVKEFLIVQTSNDNVSYEDAQALAEALGIEVTKTYTVSGTITWSGHVELSIFEDIDDVNSLRYNADVTLDVGIGTENVSDLDYDLEDMSIFER